MGRAGSSDRRSARAEQRVTTLCGARTRRGAIAPPGDLEVGIAPGRRPRCALGGELEERVHTRDSDCGDSRLAASDGELVRRARRAPLRGPAPLRATIRPTMEHDAGRDELRRSLARAGVPLFVAARSCEADVEELTSLVADLTVQDDPRLVAAIPCVLVRHAAVAVRVVETVAARLHAHAADRLRLLHRCARALAVSRAPDVEHVLGSPASLAPLSDEPSDLPDPCEDFGERFLAVAQERADVGGLIGDAVDAFDTWLRQLELDRTGQPAATDA